MAEIKFKSSGIKTDSPGLFQKVEAPPVGIKTPVEIGRKRSGLFQMHFNPISQISDNLKNLILTNHGERLGNYYFGANLQPLTTEIGSQDNFESQAMSRIQEAVRKSMPYIELETFVSNFDKSIDRAGSSKGVVKVDLDIKYSIPTLRKSGLKITVSLYCIG